MKAPSKWPSLVTGLALGPITGVLLHVIRMHVAEGRPVLATMYGVVLVQYTLLLLAFAGRLGMARF